MENLNALVDAALAEVEQAGDIRALDDVRVKYLGKKGEISALMKGLGKLSAEERPKAGAVINEGKQKVQDAITNNILDIEGQARPPSTNSHCASCHNISVAPQHPTITSSMPTVLPPGVRL